MIRNSYRQLQAKNRLWQPLIHNYLNRIRIHWHRFTDFKNISHYFPQVTEFIFVNKLKVILAAVEIDTDKDTQGISLNQEGEILVGFSEEIQQVVQQEMQAQTD